MKGKLNQEEQKLKKTETKALISFSQERNANPYSNKKSTKEKLILVTRNRLSQNVWIYLKGNNNNKNR